MNNIIRSGIIYTAMILCCSYCIAQNNILSDCDIEWRCLGPAHFGGRVTCVTGIPGDHGCFAERKD